MPRTLLNPIHTIEHALLDAHITIQRLDPVDFKDDVLDAGKRVETYYDLSAPGQDAMYARAKEIAKEAIRNL